MRLVNIVRLVIVQFSRRRDGRHMQENKMCYSVFGTTDDDLADQYRNSKQIDLQLMEESIKFKNTIRVLLLGPGESGKSTFLKQMKVLHKDGFSEVEKNEAVETIYDNIHESIYTLVTNLRKHNIQLVQQMSIRSVDYILNMGEKRPKIIPHEYPMHVKDLWLDEGVQKLYKLRNKFQLLDSTQYFLDKLDKIYDKSYVPSIDDILRARVVTKGVDEMIFSVKKANHTYDILLIDVGGQREERPKWVQVFDGVRVVLYLSACSEFDQQLREDETENRFTESLKVFRDVWRNRYFRNAGIIVFLNKTDLLEDKLRNGKRISKHLNDFIQFENENADILASRKDDPHEIEKTKEYIKYKFRQIAVPFVLKGLNKNEEILVERECTLHFTTATNTENIKKVFSDCQHIILMQNLNKWEFV